MTSTTERATPVFIAGEHPTGSQNYRLFGDCRETGPDLFFYDDKERGLSKRNKDNLANAICVGCQVLKFCRDDSIARREAYGYYGGINEQSRQVILKLLSVRNILWVDLSQEERDALIKESYSYKIKHGKLVRA